MNTHTVLIVINVTAVAAVIGFLFYRVLSSKRNPVETTPENLDPFFDDEVLEGAHLERALGVALIALIVVIVGLLAYFIWEPFRESRRGQRLQGPLDRARRDPLREQPVEELRLHQVPALRELPRCRRRRWRGAASR